jgi:hypothetical protein
MTELTETTKRMLDFIPNSSLDSLKNADLYRHLQNLIRMEPFTVNALDAYLKETKHLKYDALLQHTVNYYEIETEGWNEQDKRRLARYLMYLQHVFGHSQ